MTLLDIKNVSVNYARLSALRNVNLALEEGETLFVTGPNGAENRLF